MPTLWTTSTKPLLPTITNLRLAGDIDGLAGEVEEHANLVDHLNKTSASYNNKPTPCRWYRWLSRRSRGACQPCGPPQQNLCFLRNGNQCWEDHAGDLTLHWWHHWDQCEWTETKNTIQLKLKYLGSVVLFVYWRLITPQTAQGHLRAFHKFKSYTYHIKKKHLTLSWFKRQYTKNNT